MPILELSRDYIIKTTSNKIIFNIPNKLFNNFEQVTDKNNKILKLFGSIKNFNINPEKYQKELRKEWNR